MGLYRKRNKQRQKQESMLASTSMITESTVLPTDKQSIGTLGLIHTCDDLMLWGFKKAYCNDDLTALGNGTESELNDVWQEILYEYAGLMKTEDSTYLFELSKRILVARIDVFWIDNAVICLREMHNQDDVDRLANEYGYVLPNDYTDEDLDLVLSKAKTFIYELGEMQAEYDRLQATVGGSKQTEQDFDITIATLAKFQGFAIRQKETTVREFVGIFNLFIRHNELLQQHGAK